MRERIFIHPYRHAGLDAILRFDVYAHLERRKIRLALFARLLEVRKTRCFRQKMNIAFDLLMVGHGRTNDLLSFRQMAGLVLAHIDIIIAAVTFQEYHRRVGLHHFALLCQHLQHFAGFRRP